MRLRSDAICRTLCISKTSSYIAPLSSVNLPPLPTGIVRVTRQNDQQKSEGVMGPLTVTCVTFPFTTSINQQNLWFQSISLYSLFSHFSAIRSSSIHLSVPFTTTFMLIMLECPDIQMVPLAYGAPREFFIIAAIVQCGGADRGGNYGRLGVLRCKWSCQRYPKT